MTDEYIKRIERLCRSIIRGIWTLFGIFLAAMIMFVLIAAFITGELP